MHEEWKPILGYEAFYQVSNLGRVRSLDRNHRRGRILRPTPDKNGYFRVHLSVDGKAIKKRVCRLVLEAFNGSSDLQTRHLNGDNQDDRLVNLAWGTAFENAADRGLHGTILKAETHPNSLFTNVEVAEIRRRVANGETQIAIALEKGVSKSTISAIIQRASWDTI